MIPRFVFFLVKVSYHHFLSVSIGWSKFKMLRKAAHKGGSILLHPRQAEGYGDGIVYLLHLFRVQPPHVLPQAALVDGADLLQ